MKNKNQKEISDSEILLKIFKRRKKIIAISFVLNILIVFVALAVVGLKIFYPYHFIIGVSIYIFSYVPLVYRLYLSRRTFKKFRSYNFAKKYYQNKKKRFLYGLLAVLVLLSFFTVRPIGKSAFSDLSSKEVENLVENDLSKSIVAMDYLEVSGEELIDSLAISEINPVSTQETRDKFEEFLKAVIFSESLTEIHKYFDDISMFKAGEARAKSFMISYSLYVKKYEIIHRIMTTISNNESKKKILNEKIDFLEKSGIYQEMVVRYFEPKTRLRINLGRAYLGLFYDDSESSYGENYLILQKKSKESYKYLFNNFDKTLLSSVEISKNQIEDSMFDAWFPIQKNVANMMGNIVLMDRKDKGMISHEQIVAMKKNMNPGDVMLQRRNWHLSNVGIPGFWTHAALYTGTLEDMNKYFSSQFPLEGHSDISSYMKEKFPNLYGEYSKFDSEGNKKSVLEAIAPGVVLQSMEKSAKADFIVVIRPRLEKKDKLLSLLRAFENFGKPYDYNFDFETRDSLVCSELVYDAYAPMGEEKKGLNFNLEIVNGRKMVSPLNIAEKFKLERENSNRDFDFIYFMEGDEKSGKAVISTESRFLESVSWSKFTFLQD